MGDYGFVIGVILFTAVALFVIPPPKKRKYVGTGMVLEYRLGYIYVASRLLKSPAGEAGIDVGSCLVSFEGAAMVFDEPEEFEAVWEMVRPKDAKHKVQCVFELPSEEQKELTLPVAWIEGPIPVYVPARRRARWGQRSEICPYTGQVITRIKKRVHAPESIYA